MKKSFKLMLMAFAISLGMMSCSTNAVEDEPTPVNPQQEIKTLNIRVVSNDFTRAEGDVAEDAIQTLYLAFYKGEDTTPLYIKEATMGSNNIYSVEIPANMAKMLDKVIAFANITDKDIISGALTGSTVNEVQNENGYLIMSSAVYFENNNNNSKPIYYSSITGTETTDSETIPIYLERVAAKITVNEDNLGVLVPDIVNSPKLSMDIIGWGLTFTDNKSSLMKQLPEGYLITKNGLQGKIRELIRAEYTTWNNLNNKTISWANSINFNKFSESNLNKITLSEANNAFGSSVFVHESTRSNEDLANANSKPSIVIVGQYKNGETPLGTFYRRRDNGKDYIYTPEEYFNYLYDSQDFIYINEEGRVEKAQSKKLQEVLTLSNPSDIVDENIPDFCVSPQIMNNQSNVFCDKSGELYSIEELNKLLYNHAGLLEVYFNGQCIFIEPIKHYQNNIDIVYGMIRNHSYTLNIQTIQGFGRGIASYDTEISEEEIPEMSSSYHVNSSLMINDWNNQMEQNVNIKN